MSDQADGFEYGKFKVGAAAPGGLELELSPEQSHHDSASAEGFADRPDRRGHPDSAVVRRSESRRTTSRDGVRARARRGV